MSLTKAALRNVNVNVFQCKITECFHFNKLMSNPCEGKQETWVLDTKTRKQKILSVGQKCCLCPWLDKQKVKDSQGSENQNNLSNKISCIQSKYTGPIKFLKSIYLSE